MRKLPPEKIKEEDKHMMDFTFIYADTNPQMYFYKIKNLAWIQGLDIISLLTINFKYCGIKFTELPISYQSEFGKIDIWIVWFDEKLKQSLIEFYKDNMINLGLKLNIQRLNILPIHLLEHESFKNIIANHNKFGVEIFPIEVNSGIKELFDRIKIKYNIMRDELNYLNIII